MHALARFAARLQQRREAQLYREPVVIQQYQGRYLVRAEGTVLNFSGNDYLGLGQSDKLKAALADGATRFGPASSGSPVLTGFQWPHQKLTDLLCDWLGVDDVLLLSSGFAANQLLLHTLPDKQDQLLLDKLCHASLIDAALTAPCGYQRFAHQDLNRLHNLLQRQPRNWVVTEGVFSMDGDSPDLAAIAALSRTAEAGFILDDAHGLGVLGAEGAGSWSAQGLASGDITALMANFGKALAGQGAFIAGSQLVIDYLRQFGRHYVYSTALSPALCWAMCTAVQMARQEQWRRDKLAQHIALFRQLALQADLPLLSSDTAIQPILVGDSGKAVQLSQGLLAQGVGLSAIREPTVPRHQARLRVTLSVYHEKEDIQYLIKVLRSLW